VKTAPNLSDRASENNSVICSIPEERGIVVTILKMATSRNSSMSGINSGHHNLPTYEISLKSDNVEFVRYCGEHFENGNR
jgi:hypothetical protein